ncbi:MAG: DUF6575 domain-containing protein [Chloroflexota bacterium]
MMNILPVNTSLGKLRIFEIYEFYNMPVLFAAKNQADHIYLAVWIDETEQEDTWLYVSVSPQRFAKVRAGQVDLHDAFAKTEDGIAFKVTIPKVQSRDAQVDSLLIGVMDTSWPPLPGDYLDIPQSLPRVLWDNVDQREPVSTDYLTYVTPEPWYLQLGIRSLSMPQLLPST